MDPLSIFGFALVVFAGGWYLGLLVRARFR